MRLVDDQLTPHEEFLGLYDVPCIEAAMLVRHLLRIIISIAKFHSQCYDEASNMKGSRNGVVKQIEVAEPRALYSFVEFGSK